MTTTTTHSYYCQARCEEIFREECADQLTANWWEREAVAAEDAWVAEWVQVWLSDGTFTCVCDSPYA